MSLTLYTRLLSAPVWSCEHDNIHPMSSPAFLQAMRIMEFNVYNLLVEGDECDIVIVSLERRSVDVLIDCVGYQTL